MTYHSTLLKSSVQPTEGAQPKALYHPVDRRSNIHEIDALVLDPEFTSKVKKQSLSVACIVQEIFLTNDDSFEGFQLSPFTPKLSDAAPRVFEKEGGLKRVPFGENEKFRDEPAPGTGTGFLVGKRWVLTARHCVCEANSDKLDLDLIEEFRLIFGFQKTKLEQEKYLFKKKDVYKIVKVIAHTRLGQDWALVELDRDVEDREPLELNLTEKVTKRTAVYMLGHPSGLPLKFAHKAKVKTVGPTVLTANLHAFAGNSGSPIFEETTQKVIGIFIAGNRDYSMVSNYQETGEARVQVYRVPKEKLGSMGYEQVQRLSALNFVSHYFRACKGSKEHQYAVGLAYCVGSEIVRKQEEGIKWLRKAASQGYIPAHLKLLEFGACFVYDLVDGTSVSIAIDEETKSVSFYMGEVSSSISITLKDFLLGPFRPSSPFSFKRLSEHDKRFLFFEYLREGKMEKAEELFLEHKNFYKQCFRWEAFGLLVIETDHAESLRFLVEKGFSFKGFNTNPLAYAYTRKAFNAFRALLSVSSVDIVVRCSETGRTLFHVLCETGQNELLAAYCEEFKKRNVRLTSLLIQPLYLAVKNRNGRAAEIVVEAGVPFIDQLRHWAFLMRDVKLELGTGGLPSLKTKSKKTEYGFFWQVFTWDFDRRISPQEKIELLRLCCDPFLKCFEDYAVKRLIQTQIAPFDKKYMLDVQGNGPLHLVLKSPNFTPVFKLYLISLLLDGKHSADINLANKRGETPLILAAQNDSVTVYNLLQIEGIEVARQDERGNTALHYAALLGSENRTRALISYKGINLDIPNKEGLTPYQLARTNQIATILEEAGADTKAKSKYGVVVEEKYTPSEPLKMFKKAASWIMGY